MTFVVAVSLEERMVAIYLWQLLCWCHDGSNDDMVATFMVVFHAGYGYLIQ